MEKFSLGKVVITRNASDVLDMCFIPYAIARHQSGDWGDLCVDDLKNNNDALINGERLLSAYTDTFGIKFWIITESDRSTTTILLPEDY